ncbi:MAG: type III-A CRISPR-associated RAMP protein Csm4 [Bryobacteraceae bacterium]
MPYIRFHPVGPWRFGPGSGARDRVDPICHSDTVFSAITHAIDRLGWLNEWIEAAAQPAVRFSSLYPFQRETLFVTPPRSIWPPPASGKIRYKAAHLVPLAVIESLLAGQPIDEDRWTLDGESGCLIPADRNRPGGPFRIGIRSNAAVDRLSPNTLATHSTACLEFAPDAGLWMQVVFADDDARNAWGDRVKGALRLLADSGIGGERSRGWGRSAQPEWHDDGELFQPPAEAQETAYWLLSLYAPAPEDSIDWNSGSYSTLSRSGRIESAERWGDLKAPGQMIEEGSVLLSPRPPRGSIRNVAPEGFPHPVLRAGYAVTVPIPWVGHA